MSLESLQSRLNYHGGMTQNRMIRDKAYSMKTAIKNSYQGATFNLYLNDKGEVSGLFNPITKNENFDTKMLSVEWSADYKVGDVFKWNNTQTYWIIFLQDKTELAYFRGECRRCDYELKWIDKDRIEQHTLVSIIGPSVPTIRTSSSMQAKVAQDFPNANLKILASATPENTLYFHRYQTFLLKGISYQIEEIDDISMPGVIQMNATEYYTDMIENDVEENLRNAWNIQPVHIPYDSEYAIEGPITMVPKHEAEFTALMRGGYWFIKDNVGLKGNKLNPAEFVEYDLHQQTVHVVWNNMKSGSFTIVYEMPNGKQYERYVVVESLM